MMIEHSDSNGHETLHERLRRETQAIHERLENGVAVNVRLAQRILFDSLTPQEADAARDDYRNVYARYLVGAFGFERAMELMTRETEAGRRLHKLVNMDPEPGPPSELIRRDLADVNTNGSHSNLQIMPNSPRLDSLSLLLGAEYVRRGSRMGGVVLARIVKDNLGLDEQTGARFLNLHGPEVRPKFMAFCEAMNGLDHAAVNADEVVAAACETFEAIFAWQKLLEANWIRHIEESTLV